MAVKKFQTSLWALVRRQHGVISRRQLLALGFSSHAIQHRIDVGRLHPVWPGVYAVGRPELSQNGRWMAAVLACGHSAALSHPSAGALWGIVPVRPGPVQVSVPLEMRRRRNGIYVHRSRAIEPSSITQRLGIPVTKPVLTLVNLAAVLDADALEAAVNEADSRGVIDPERLRVGLERYAPIPGAAALRKTLDQHTFTRTDSWLERAFRPIVQRAGLPKPVSRKWLNGFRVDFYWAELGLVVETDSLTYHRTPAQQATDRRRDQAHTVAGLIALRFTHAQIRYEPAYVEATLTAVATRLRAKSGTSSRLQA
ncbi:MAG TPA: type IV toxin-antitoxin system AbiEi family antitoxin domain-containing protein [Thermoleophilaceae bacterium]|nr:type IV toxin-antitoxin system AbiEi family antitoxin domain-containing protein [Thermoleophilaceae bacterium]